MSAVTVLGLGAMGQRMAANLIQEGHDLRVWNRSNEACQELSKQGAQVFDSPREAVQGAEVVIAMLRDDEASRVVWLDERGGALGGMGDKAVAVECSTLSLAWCRQLASAMSQHGMDFLDAPVVGSRPQAEAKQLIHLVGGDPDVLVRVQAVLQANAAAIHYQGGHGAGMAMKLAVNALFGIQVAALGELLSFLGHCGIAPESAARLLGELPVTSPAAKGAALAIAVNNYAPMFPVELAKKDLGYAIDSIPGASLPVTAAVLGLFKQASDQGYGAENIHAVARLFQVTGSGS